MIELDPTRAAERAFELLERLAELDAALVDIDPMKRIELEVTGGARRLNAQQDWTRELAQTYALASIAGALVEWLAREPVE
jgi:hypothetical protein